MSIISEGLTTGPDAAMEASDEALRGQAETRERTAASHNLEDANATKDEIRAAFFEATGVKSGLVRADDVDRHGNTAADREAIFAEGRAREMSPEFVAQINAAEANRNRPSSADAAELADRRQTDIIDNLFEEGVEWVGEYEDDTNEGVEEFNVVARDWAKLTPENKVAFVRAEHITGDQARALDARGVKLAEDHAAVKFALQTARGNAQDETRRDNSFAAFAAANHWSPEEQQFAYTQLDEQLRAAGLGSVNSADPDIFEQVMRGDAERLRATGQALEDRDFKQRILNETGSDIASGLTVASPQGHVRLNPPVQLVARPDYSGVEPAMSGKFTRGPTDAEIKRGVLEESPMTAEMRHVRASADRERTAALKAREIFGAPLR